MEQTKQTPQELEESTENLDSLDTESDNDSHISEQNEAEQTPDLAEMCSIKYNGLEINLGSFKSPAIILSERVMEMYEKLTETKSKKKAGSYLG